jgi:tRNA (Thr-GGU) A37 N-methylase
LTQPPWRVGLHALHESRANKKSTEKEFDRASTYRRDPPLKRRKAPKQGSGGAPDAWLEVRALAMESFDGLMVDDEIIILTWLHRARRDALKTGSLSGATAISIDDREHRLVGILQTPPHRRE